MDGPVMGVLLGEGLRAYEPHGLNQTTLTPDQIELERQRYQAEAEKRDAEYRLEAERQRDRELRIIALNAASTVLHGANATSEDVLAQANDFLVFLKPNAN
jgi:hypothetical protein